jgi:hypothetical protein
MNYAIVLANNGKTDDAKAQFFCSEKIYQDLDEDEKEQEMMDARHMLSQELGIEIGDRDGDDGDY